MKSYLIAVLLVAASALQVSECKCKFSTNHKVNVSSVDDASCKAFLKVYYPSYVCSADPDCQRKMKCLKDNIKKYLEHNCNKSYFDIGLNKKSFSCPEDFAKTLNPVLGEHTAERLAAVNGTLPQSSASEAVRQLPTNFSWVDLGKVASVKDQGSCGCCYAFAAAAVLESAYAITCNAVPPELSPQQYVDCAYYFGYKSGSSNVTRCKNGVCNVTTTFYTNYYNNVTWGNKGCNGGVSSFCWAYNLNTSSSQDLIGDYPFVSGLTQTQQTCQYVNSTAVHITVKNFTYTNVGDEVGIQNALVQYGPLACGVDASTLSPYAGGIFTGAGCSNVSTNHAITVVGYGTQNGVPYWLIKNSWGSSWGLNGYFMLYRGNNTCGIGLSCAYITVGC